MNVSATSNLVNPGAVMAKALRATTVFLLVICCSVVHAEQTNEVDFEQHIVPILQEHCLRCHSPGNRKGDISLATYDDLQANGYVSPGDPDGSYLIELVVGDDGEPPRMPQDAPPLSPAEIAMLRSWIEQGSDWPPGIEVREKSKADASWWSLRPLSASLPGEWSSRSIEGHRRAAMMVDEFVRKQLSEQGLSLNPPADRRSLIRRAYYDLIGLPPTPEEVEAFVNDTDPAAFEKLIDRLLASPHYGERWGRHWLDVVRFGESNGYERNVVNNDLWPFRDYVIRSINDDKPFDQLIREHIAGDVIAKDDPEIAVGSAFLVAGPYDDVGNQDPVQAAQIRANTIDEMISATGEAFLGMTLGCAKCHDHKFDPITQEDYYGLYATFAGVQHGSVTLADTETKENHNARLAPLRERKAQLEKALAAINAAVLGRARAKLPEYEAAWTRDPIDRTWTEDRFAKVEARFVRLVCEAQDRNPDTTAGFGIDEFEVWSAANEPKNVALAANGGRASGLARESKDFPDAYSPELAIDGEFGARFIAMGSDLTIELAEPTWIDRVVFSSARFEPAPEHAKFAFVAEYRLEVSLDGATWQVVASSADRQPVPNQKMIDHRLLREEATPAEIAEKEELARELGAVEQGIAEVPPLPSVWIGRRSEEAAQGPFHVFLGGNPQQLGANVVPASVVAFSNVEENAYRLAADTSESERRRALADWLVHPENPLTLRVLANRLWQYHFGVGIVDTPNDFGYMGGRPTHPELLDFLAIMLRENNWRLKPMHRMMMLTDTYQQSSAPDYNALQTDSDSRLLWRFPPRRLSAEEIRDSILQVAGKLNLEQGGPGFRLYRAMQDNVTTYVPLDQHGPDTYRRAVYHQNVRASVVDLLTDFDQPDCAFSAPERAETTTPLQSLTMLNHSFTLDMASALAARLRTEAGDSVPDQIDRAYRLCYSRSPAADELVIGGEFIRAYGLEAFCRVLLNSSELIYVF